MRIIKWTIIILFIAALILCLGGLLLWSGLKEEPDFYRELAVTSENSEQAQADSDSMRQKVAELRKAIRTKEHWEFDCTQDELNHWLAVYIRERHPGMIPRQLKDPRGVVLPDGIRAGITVDTPEYKGVLSVDILPEVEAPNVLVARLRRIRLGVVSIPLRAVRTIVGEAAQQYALPIEWMESEGEPKLRLKLQNSDIRYDHRDILIESIEIRGRSIHLSGSCTKVEP